MPELQRHRCDALHPLTGLGLSLGPSVRAYVGTRPSTQQACLESAKESHAQMEALLTKATEQLAATKAEHASAEQALAETRQATSAQSEHGLAHETAVAAQQAELATLGVAVEALGVQVSVLIRRATSFSFVHRISNRNRKENAHPGFERRRRVIHSNVKLDEPRLTPCRVVHFFNGERGTKKVAEKCAVHGCTFLQRAEREQALNAALASLLTAKQHHMQLEAAAARTQETLNRQVAVRENVERELEQSRVRSREQLADMRREEKAARKTLEKLTVQLETMGRERAVPAMADGSPGSSMTNSISSGEAEIDSSVRRVSDYMPLVICGRVNPNPTLPQEALGSAGAQASCWEY